jgi:hypothetical protein
MPSQNKEFPQQISRFRKATATALVFVGVLNMAAPERIAAQGPVTSVTSDGPVPTTFLTTALERIDQMFPSIPPKDFPPAIQGKPFVGSHKFPDRVFANVVHWTTERPFEAQNLSESFGVLCWLTWAATSSYYLLRTRARKREALRVYAQKNPQAKSITFIPQIVDETIMENREVKEARSGTCAAIDTNEHYKGARNPDRRVRDNALVAAWVAVTASALLGLNLYSVSRLPLPNQPPDFLVDFFWQTLSWNQEFYRTALTHWKNLVLSSIISVYSLFFAQRLEDFLWPPPWGNIGRSLNEIFRGTRYNVTNLEDTQCARRDW